MTIDQGRVQKIQLEGAEASAAEQQQLNPLAQLYKKYKNKNVQFESGDWSKPKVVSL